MQSTQYVQARDNSGFEISNYLAGTAFAFDNDGFILTINTPKTITVPELSCRKVIAIFTYTAGADIWVYPSATPTFSSVPSSGGQTLAQLRPKIRVVDPGQTLQFLYQNTVFAESVVTVGIQYFLGPQNLS